MIYEYLWLKIEDDDGLTVSTVWAVNPGGGAFRMNYRELVLAVERVQLDFTTACAKGDTLDTMLLWERALKIEREIDENAYELDAYLLERGFGPYSNNYEIPSDVALQIALKEVQQ